MRLLSFRPVHSVAMPLLISVALFTQGCAYKKTMVFQSPSKRSAVEIWQTAIDNSWHMRVELTTGTKRFRIYQSPNEAFAHFVHVYWAPDETRVGLIATGSGLWELAFDTRAGTPIPFSEIHSEMARSIAETYQLGQQDPISWASSTDAAARFFESHPEIHVTYGPTN
jgi:hypothetical protein